MFYLLSISFRFDEFFSATDDNTVTAPVRDRLNKVFLFVTISDFISHVDIGEYAKTIDQ